MPNPQQPKIILVDHAEMDADGRESFLSITGTDGAHYRIPEKRHTLWEVFKTIRRGEPILTVFETYNGIDYIVDARKITDEILNSAVVYSVKNATEVITQERNRSQSLSYSKDMVIAGIVPLEDIYDRSKQNYEFITGIDSNKEADTPH